MSHFRKFCGLLLPVAMMFLLNSCASYYMNDRPLDYALDGGGEIVLLVWDGHVFELRDPQVTDEKLTGVMVGVNLVMEKPTREIEEVPEENSPMIVRDEEYPVFDDHGKKSRTNEVHILVSSQYSIPEGFDPQIPREVSIPLAQIDEVQVRELHGGLTIVKTFGVMVLLAGIGFLIVLATKDSCPFIYVMDGEDALLVGEIYSGAIHPPLERHDYMPLPVNGEGPCQLKITNEVLEIQHTNLAELLVFDHAPDSKVLLDRHGRAHLLEQPVLPVKTTPILESNTGMDGMVLTFDRDPNADSMQLVVDARNSRWLDHVLGMLFEQMGDMFKPWQEAQKLGSVDDMQRWSQEQGLPLAVSLLTPDGWQYVDYIDLVGPIASRESVVGIDLSGLTGDKVTVKLECGYRFWEIDNVQASFTTDEAPLGTTVSIDMATNQDGQDVRHLLVGDDDKYLHQPEYTDATIMDFNLPPLTRGMGRSVILHSKGHYDILRDPSGVPDASFIAGFTKPASVSAYSRAMYHASSSGAGN